MFFLYLEALYDHIPLFVSISLILTLFLYLIRPIAFHRKRNLLHSFWQFCFIFYIQALYDVTLGISRGILGAFSIPDAYRRPPNLVPLIDLFKVYSMGLEMMLIQVLMNIALMAPLGFLLPLLFHQFQSFSRTTLTVLVTSLIIETLQYFADRSSDIDDVIMNTLGGILGYLLFKLCRKVMTAVTSHHKFSRK